MFFQLFGPFFDQKFFFHFFGPLAVFRGRTFFFEKNGKFSIFFSHQKNIPETLSEGQKWTKNIKKAFFKQKNTCIVIPAGRGRGAPLPAPRLRGAQALRSKGETAGYFMAFSGILFCFSSPNKENYLPRGRLHEFFISLSSPRGGGLDFSSHFFIHNPDFLFSSHLGESCWVAAPP